MPHNYHQFKTIPLPKQNFHITNYCNATAVKWQLIINMCSVIINQNKKCDINLSKIQ